jgi:hypothetical protein
MTTCPSCGFENDDDARMCAACQVLLSRADSREQTLFVPEAAAPDPSTPLFYGAPGDAPPDVVDGTSDRDNGSAEPAPRAAPAPPPPPRNEPSVDFRAVRPDEPGAALPPDDDPDDENLDVVTAAHQQDESEQSSAPEPGPPCEKCGTHNRPGRRYCKNCGHALNGDGASGPPPAEVPTNGEAPKTDRQRWRAALRSDNVRVDKVLDLRARVARAFIIGVFALAALSQFPPWGPGVRSWITDRFPNRYHSVTVTDKRTFPATTDQTDPHGPQAVVDGKPETYWRDSLRTPVPGRGDNSVCNPVAATGSDLILSYLPAGNIDRIVVRAGVKRTNDGVWSRAAQPAELSITASGEGPQTFSLKDTDEPQVVPFKARDVSEITVQITKVCPPAADAQGAWTALSELTLERR